MGLYGGALLDAHDRRKVALLASAVMWASGILTALQAWLGNTHPLVLYLLLAVNSAGFAAVSPARSAIYPRLLERRLPLAANALGAFAFNVALTVGPLLAGFLIAGGGNPLAYSVDVVLFTSALWGLLRLPPIPPDLHPEGLSRALFHAVAALAFGGGARTVGFMTAAIAAGSVTAMLFSEDSAICGDMDWPSWSVSPFGASRCSASGLRSARPAAF